MEHCTELLAQLRGILVSVFFNGVPNGNLKHFFFGTAMASVQPLSLGNCRQSTVLRFAFAIERSSPTGIPENQIARQAGPVDKVAFGLA